MDKNIANISILYRLEKIFNNKKIIIFLICLVIATVFWLLNALNKDISTTLTFAVNYTNAPGDQYLSNVPRETLELKIEGRGFSLLKYKLALTNTTLDLNLTELTENLIENNGFFYITSGNLMRSLQSQVGDDFKINEIKPEYIAISFAGLNSKTVPVELNISLTFKQSYNLLKPISIEPKNIELKGVSSALDTIKSIRSVPFELSKLDSDTEKEIKLIKPRGVFIFPDKVKVKVYVDKFTEKEIQIPIQFKNVPDGIRIKLFPSEVKASFNIGLKEYNNVSASQFKIFIDYNSIDTKKANLKIEIETLPDYIQNFRLSPEFVEYLIES